MKRYIEAESQTLRTAFEAHVMSWPLVSTRKMFGCPSYKAGDKLFAFLVSNAVVLTRLDAAARAELSGVFGARPFSAGNRTMVGWSEIPIAETTILAEVMPYVRVSYQAALAQEDDQARGQ